MLKRNSIKDEESFTNSYSQPTFILQGKSISDKSFPQYLHKYKISTILILNLRNNSLEGEIPTWDLLRHFTHLKTLDLSHNHLKHCYLNYLPQSIQTLDISFNSISELNFQCYLKQLKQLNLQNNILLRFQVACQNESLTILNISNNKLSVLGVAQFTSLFQIYASHNQIVVINLPSSLRKIDLSHNILKTLVFLSKLPLVEYLDVSNNQLKDLELRSLEYKTYFQYLNASYNKIKFIDGFQAVSNLEIINLSYNYLSTRMIDQVLKLKQLKEFQCRGNFFENSAKQIQEKEKQLKKKLPIRTLKIFDLKQQRQSDTQLNTPHNTANATTRGHSSQRKRTHKKYAYVDHYQIEPQKAKSQRNKSQITIKQSPFKLFVDSGKKPSIYTLGNFDDGASDLKKTLQQQPETKYFLQILNKYFMIPLKPILKRDIGNVHKHEIFGGIEYNLIKDLYRSFNLKFNKIFKVTNLKEQQQINKFNKQNKESSLGHSLYFLHRQLEQHKLEKYYKSETSFKEVLRSFSSLQFLGISIFPSQKSKNYIIKTSFVPSHSSSKESYQFNGSHHYFSLIFIIE